MTVSKIWGPVQSNRSKREPLKTPFLTKKPFQISSSSKNAGWWCVLEDRVGNELLFNETTKPAVGCHKALRLISGSLARALVYFNFLVNEILMTHWKTTPT